MGGVLPVLTSDEILKILFRSGFTARRKRGSHVILAKGAQRVVVPVHKGRDVPKGTLLNIIRQAGLNKRDLIS